MKNYEGRMKLLDKREDELYKELESEPIELSEEELDIVFRNSINKQILEKNLPEINTLLNSMED